MQGLTRQPIDAWEAALPHELDAVKDGTVDADINADINADIDAGTGNDAGNDADKSAAAAESTTWRPLEVPGCWEAQGFPILQDELWYRARVHLDSAGHRDFDPAWHRIWLHFEGVSHSCSVEVNGIQVGEHAGIWTPFAFDVTDAVLKRSDRGAGTNTADILVKVRKPVERDAIRGALAGFLPYVWGHVFGGIWQPVTLRTTGPAVIDGVWIRGWVDGRVRVRTEVQVHKSRPGTDLDEWRLDWLVKDVSGEIVAQGNTACRRGSGTQGTQGTQLVEWEFELPDPKPWSLRSPHLYTMEISLYQSVHASKPGSQPAGTAPGQVNPDEATPGEVGRAEAARGETARGETAPGEAAPMDGAPGYVTPAWESDRWAGQFGLRDLEVRGEKVFLNGEPIYPRGILHWGWHPERIAPILSREEIETELDKVTSLGFNMVKHCLYTPVAEYWQACDERGILAWLELPMWLPKVDEAFRRQALTEYREILRRVRNHPSLAIVTLGCELNREVDAKFLKELYDLAKEMTGLPLIRDNSGSAEAYGGNAVEYADFYDYHFYCEPHDFDRLNDAFAPRWRERQPTIYGEYLDSDTFRDLRALADRAGVLPWWTQDDPVKNPQGVRWEYNVVHQLERLEAAGLIERSQEIVEISHRQTMALRKAVLEKTRANESVSGYVITCISDQPISTSGVLDDLQRLKFRPEEMRAINDDDVLLLDWDRARSWTNGGDRPHPYDRYNHRSGAQLRAHLILSTAAGAAKGLETHRSAKWQLVGASGEVLGAGEVVDSSPPPLDPGRRNIRLGVIQVALPEVDAPTKVRLIASTENGLSNEWPLWIYPPVDTEAFRGVCVWDPSGEIGRYAGRHPIAEAATWLPGWQSPTRSSSDLPTDAVLITTGWNEALEDWVSAGGRALLLQTSAGPLPALGRPFWREAVKLLEPHPALDPMQHGGFADLQFYGLATDFSLDTEAFLQAFKERHRDRRGIRRHPVITRLDARSMEVSDYVVHLPIDRGHLLVCTLRLWGGLGDQPVGLARNVAGSALLEQMIDWLRSAAPGSLT